MTASAIVIVKAMFACTKAIIMAINEAANVINPIPGTGIGIGFLQEARDRAFIDIAKELEKQKEAILK